VTPDEFQAATGVSRETIHRLLRYEELLREWQKRINLVGPSTLDDIWGRHFFDSAQLLPLIPKTAKTVVDLGSGAGFPGLVLAIALVGRPGLEVRLIEATGKKAQFLEAVVRETDAPAKVVNDRAESLGRWPADVITARACAPLPELLAYAKNFTKKGSICLFPKGKTLEAELTGAARNWRIIYTKVESQTDPSSHILVIRDFAPRVRP
jgi:16S rRNA (guanine527-N7)-methyltransferase